MKIALPNFCPRQNDGLIAVTLKMFNLVLSNDDFIFIYYLYSTYYGKIDKSYFNIVPRRQSISTNTLLGIRFLSHIILQRRIELK